MVIHMRFIFFVGAVLLKDCYARHILDAMSKCKDRKSCENSCLLKDFDGGFCYNSRCVCYDEESLQSLDTEDNSNLGIAEKNRILMKSQKPFLVRQKRQGPYDPYMYDQLQQATQYGYNPAQTPQNYPMSNGYPSGAQQHLQQATQYGYNPAQAPQNYPMSNGYPSGAQQQQQQQQQQFYPDQRPTYDPPVNPYIAPNVNQLPNPPLYPVDPCYDPRNCHPWIPQTKSQTLAEPQSFNDVTYPMNQQTVPDYMVYPDYGSANSKFYEPQSNAPGSYPGYYPSPNSQPMSYGSDQGGVDTMSADMGSYSKATSESMSENEKSKKHTVGSLMMTVETADGKVEGGGKIDSKVERERSLARSRAEAESVQVGPGPLAQAQAVAQAQAGQAVAEAQGLAQAQPQNQAVQPNQQQNQAGQQAPPPQQPMGQGQQVSPSQQYQGPGQISRSKAIAEAGALSEREAKRTIGSLDMSVTTAAGVVQGGGKVDSEVERQKNEAYTKSQSESSVQTMSAGDFPQYERPANQYPYPQADTTYPAYPEPNYGGASNYPQYPVGGQQLDYGKSPTYLSNQQVNDPYLRKQPAKEQQQKDIVTVPFYHGQKPSYEDLMYQDGQQQQQQSGKQTGTLSGKYGYDAYPQNNMIYPGVYGPQETETPPYSKPASNSYYPQPYPYDDYGYGYNPYSPYGSSDYGQRENGIGTMSADEGSGLATSTATAESMALNTKNDKRVIGSLTMGMKTADGELTGKTVLDSKVQQQKAKAKSHSKAESRAAKQKQ